MIDPAAVPVLALGVSQVAAHGGVLSYSINGQTYQGYVIRLWRCVLCQFTHSRQIQGVQHPGWPKQHPARVGHLQPHH